MKRFVKPLAVFLAAFILLTGCQMTDTSWAYSYNEETMPAGLYINYLLTSYSDAVNKLYEEEQAAMLLNYDPDAASVADMKMKDVLKLELEGVPVSDWVTANTQKLAKRYFAVNAKMAEAGVTQSQADIDTAATAARSSMDSYSELYRTNGIAESSLALSIQSELAKEQLFLELYGKGGQLEVPESELKEYFSSKYAKMQHMYFVKPTINSVEYDESDPEGTKNEEKLAQLQTEIEANARGYFERLEGGESIEDLVYEREKEQSEDPDSVTKYNAGELDFIISDEDVAYVGQTMLDGIFSAKPGDYLFLEDDNYYYLVHVLDVLEDPDDMDSYRDNLLYEMRFEDVYLPMLDELGGTLELTVNQNSLNRYTPSKIKM